MTWKMLRYSVLSLSWSVLLRPAQNPETLGKIFIAPHLPLAENDQGPWDVRELTTVIVRLFFIMFETGQLRDVPEDWKKSNVATLFRKKEPGTTGWLASPQHLGRCWRST